jgi:choline kinase
LGYFCAQHRLRRKSMSAFVGLFLIAGTGTRLMPITAHKPKALVELEGRTLLDRLLQVCIAEGMTEAVLVTGHGAQAVEQFVANWQGTVPLKTVYNPEYATLGNAHSVWVARELVAGRTFVKFDGDVVLHRDILRRLAACPWSSAIALDTRADVDEEAMKAQVLPSGKVAAMGKWLRTAMAQGESIGVERIGAEHSEQLFRAIERVVHKEGRSNAYYEDVYHVLVTEGWELGAADVGGVPWCEIDTPADFENARAALPAIESI